MRSLEVLSDEQLHLYLLQLVQALRFEFSHDSALSRFMLRRALQAPKLIGHTFYWMLKVRLAPLRPLRFGRGVSVHSARPCTCCRDARSPHLRLSRVRSCVPWLQAELHVRDVRDRYSVLLQQYLKNCGDHRVDLGHQMFVTKKLQMVRRDTRSCGGAPPLRVPKVTHVRSCCLPACHTGG